MVSLEQPLSCGTKCNKSVPVTGWSNCCDVGMVLVGSDVEWRKLWS